MTKILKREDLAKAMTEKMALYIAQGYIIDIDHNNNGHQGEECRTVLKKGNEYIAIYLDINSVRLSEKYYLREYATYFRVESFRDVPRFESLWLGRGKTIEETLFYHLQGYDSEVYTTDKEFTISVMKKQFERANTKYSEGLRTFKPTERILKITKNHYGYKRTKLEDIAYIIRNDMPRNYDNPGQTRPYYDIRFKDFKKRDLRIR